jgi:hypothetical protein
MTTSNRFSNVSRLAVLTSLALVAASCRATPTKPVTTAAAQASRPTATKPVVPEATVTPRKVLINTPQAAPSATVQASALGVKGISGRLTITPTKAETMPALGGQSPRPGDVYWVVTVTLEDTDTKTSVSFDPANALLIDPTTSATYAPVSTSSMVDALRAESIAPNAQLEGVLIFEAPQSLANPQFEFLSGGGNTPMWSLRA